MASRRPAAAGRAPRCAARGRRASLLAVLTTIAALGPALPAAALGRFQLGLEEPTARGAAAPLLFSRIQATGAGLIRGSASWRAIAPGGFTRPAGFDPRNPADPQYQWAALDEFVRGAHAHGLEAILAFSDAPTWAEGTTADRAQGDHAWPGAFEPNAGDLGDFAFAVATRYGGHFPDPLTPARALPPVRFIQAWNEPNFRRFLYPQGEIVHGRPVNTAAPRYVAMLNAVYDNVKRAVPSDLVVSAGLGPFGSHDRATRTSPVNDSDPQYFMRAMFCLTRARRTLRAQRGCRLRPRFDVFAHHPYSVVGTPTSKGISMDDGAMGNLPAIRQTLDAAVRLGHVYPAGHKRFWVTEFDWWSNPPSTSEVSAPGTGAGKPLAVQARYLSESAYRMWREGVDTMIWYLLRDGPSWPGGLYLAGSSPQSDRPKPALQAFELPFYAFRAGGRLVVWALSPGGNLRIERRSGSGWARVATVAPSRSSVAYARLGGQQAGGSFRAVALSGRRRGLASYPYPVR